MRLPVQLLAMLASSAALAKSQRATTDGFPSARLIVAAKAAPLKLIDALEVG